MQFHILSFEGPDGYARAGGISSRISGLADALAEHGFDTHLWFVGDPDLPGLERRGNLTLHRWCQWISKHCRGGVYDGEEAKAGDYARSLPPFLFTEVLAPHLDCGGGAVVLAEEWQTVHAVLHLDWLLRGAGKRGRVRMLWNANNVFGFDRVDWPRLSRAATVTTVSRYMKHLMWPLGVNALVIPNGLSADSFLRADRQAVGEIRRLLQGRTLLAKMARFDPDKRWIMAIDTVDELKRRGRRPLLIARGGVESHRQEVFEAARTRGLKVREVPPHGAGSEGLVRALRAANGEDILHLSTPVDAEARRTLFRSVDAVLANSGRLRRAARAAAKSYAWPEIIERNLLPRLELVQR